MAVGGNTGGAGGAKNLAKVDKGKRQAKKVKKLAQSLPKGPPPPKNAPKPNFPTKVPVRPGAPTNRYSSKPSTQAQRTHVHKVRAERSKLIAKKPSFSTANTPVHHKRKQKASDIYLSNPAALKAAGFSPEHEGLVQAPLRVPVTLGKAAKLTAETVKEKPSTAAKLPVDVGKSLLAVPSALIRTGLHPVKAAEQIAHDYSRRYGGLYENKPGAGKKFKERQKKEGIAPEVLDFTSFAAAGGATVGRGLQTVARAGGLGKKAEEIATAERPAVQVGGQAIHQHPKGKNFISNAIKHGTDIARTRNTARVIAKAEKKDRTVPLEHAEAARTGNVARISRFRTKQVQRTRVAKVKGRAISRQKVEQQTLDRELYKRARKVDPYAFKYATQYGIRSAKQAREVLSKHLADIETERRKAVEYRAAKKEVDKAREEYAIARAEPDGNVEKAFAGLEAAKKKAADVRPKGGFTGEIIKKQDEVPHLERLLKNPEIFDHPMLHGAVNAGATAARKVAEESPGIADLQAIERRIAPQAEHLGIVRHEGESQTDYLTRAQQAIKDSGLKPGEYYPSQKRLERQALNRTVGGGSGAMKGPKSYTGALTSTGREHASLDLFANSLHQEVRRKHNWNLVNKVFEEHTVPWSRDKNFNEIKDLIDHHNIDHGSVTYVDFNKIQKAKKLDQHPTFQDTEFKADKSVQEELDKAFVDPAYVAKHPDEFRGTRGALVPREVANELRSGFQQSGAFGRGYRIAKGSASRVLLSNPVWLQFQIMANALTTATHHPGALIDAFQAAHKFKDPEWKALESDIGVHKFYDDRAHLGAAVNNNAFVDGWRAWQKVGAGSLKRYAAHPVREFFNLFHRGDTAQNNFFRRAVLYNDVKRQAYRNMARDSGRMVATQQRLMNILKLKDPEEQMNAIIRDPHLFEQHAQAVDDFLGNWTSYTAKERKILGNVMFGGFIRFSTRLAFYTMPMQHPIMYSIALQLGRLENDELKQIFGTDPPPWEIGNYYSKDGKAKFRAIRLNPFANALTQIGTSGSGGNSIVNALPPIATLLIDQFAKENVGQQQPWYINGKQVDVRQNVPVGSRAKMIAEAILQLSPFYRSVEKYGVPGVVKPLRGKQNSDSGVFFPSPRQYKRSDAVQRNEELKREQDKASPLGVLTPFGDRSGRVTIKKAQAYAESQHKRKAPKRSKPQVFPGMGSGTGSGWPGMGSQ